VSKHKHYPTGQRYKKDLGVKKDFTHRWLEVDFLHTKIKAFHFSALIKSFFPF